MDKTRDWSSLLTSIESTAIKSLGFDFNDRVETDISGMMETALRLTISNNITSLPITKQSEILAIVNQIVQDAVDNHEKEQAAAVAEAEAQVVTAQQALEEAKTQ